MKKRKLFCELSPAAYRISVWKGRVVRHIRDAVSFVKFAEQKSGTPLPVCVYQHSSLIRRRLGNVDLQLQGNKAVNLSLAAPKVSGVLIRPGETFSFWHMVGCPSSAEGYREGLTISGGRVSSGTGGGMCQFTNLIHWLVLHSPLNIVEHHHHDGLDLFPDHGRQIPFGTGTSIMYNYLDYRFHNPTGQAYQLVVYTTDEYLCGELRTTEPLPVAYHIKGEDERFVEDGGAVFRTGKVFRERIDKATGALLSRELIKTNYARVMYETKDLVVSNEEK